MRREFTPCFILFKPIKSDEEEVVELELNQFGTKRLIPYQIKPEG